MFQLFANHIDTSQGYVKAVAVNKGTVTDTLKVIFSNEEIEALHTEKESIGAFTKYSRYCQLLVEINYTDTITIIIYDFKDNDLYFEQEYNKLIGANKKEEAGKMLLNYCRIIKDHVLYAEIVLTDPVPPTTFITSNFHGGLLGNINLS